MNEIMNIERKIMGSSPTGIRNKTLGSSSIGIKSEDHGFKSHRHYETMKTNERQA